MDMNAILKTIYFFLVVMLGVMVAQLFLLYVPYGLEILGVFAISFFAILIYQINKAGNQYIKKDGISKEKQ